MKMRLGLAGSETRDLQAALRSRVGHRRPGGSTVRALEEAAEVDASENARGSAGHEGQARGIRGCGDRGQAARAPRPCGARVFALVDPIVASGGEDPAGRRRVGEEGLEFGGDQARGAGGEGGSSVGAVVGRGAAYICLEGRGRGEIDGAGGARDVGVPRVVHGEAVDRIDGTAAEVGAEDQMPPAETREEGGGVNIRAGGLERVQRGEVAGVGVPRHVDVARRAQGHARCPVVAIATKIGGEEEGRPVGVHFRKEGVAGTLPGPAWGSPSGNRESWWIP